MIKEELNKIKEESTLLPNREEVIRNTLNHIEVDGDVLEFGVHVGRSLRVISECEPHRNIYGFDSFTGLPEAWPGREHDHKKGMFTTGGAVPKINNPNITYVKGYYEDTLPQFFNTYDNNIAFINIDCDIYPSTVTILNNIKSHIHPGLVILFDELIGYDGFELNEMKAWLEFSNKETISYTYLYHHQYQVSLKINQ